MRSALRTIHLLFRHVREIAAVVAMKAPISAEGLRLMRRAIGMRGFELATLLDVRGETLSRWEHAWLLLGSLVLEQTGHSTQTHDRLVHLRKPANLPKTVRLDISRPGRDRLPRMK